MALQNAELPPNPNDRISYLPERLKTIILAAGNFWSAQAFFTRIRGVAECTAGYVNGILSNPNYERVEAGDSGYAFALRIRYNPEFLSIGRLLEIFFKQIDPIAIGHQGYDWGSQYRSGVYFLDPEDEKEIELAFALQISRFENRISTELKQVENFVKAEVEQQHYLEKHPEIYRTMDFSVLEEFNKEDTK